MRMVWDSWVLHSPPRSLVFILLCPAGPHRCCLWCLCALSACSAAPATLSLHEMNCPLFLAHYTPADELTWFFPSIFLPWGKESFLGMRRAGRPSFGGRNARGVLRPRESCGTWIKPP